MKARPIDQIVYESMFPRPKASDPQNFYAFLQANLVIEVRQETQSFYGSLDSREAQYPGLDYSFPPHRARLSRFPWHRRLFRTFDALGLTKSEIATLTKWEGTKWAKERFEKEQGIKIRDTSGDCIRDWVDPKLRGPAFMPPYVPHHAQEGEMRELDEEDEDEDEEEDEDCGSEDEEDMEMEIDIITDVENLRVARNERRRVAATPRAAGNATTVMDEEWEQFLKEAAEAGGLPYLADQIMTVSNSTTAEQVSRSAALHPRILNAARLGQWHQIPEFLHSLVRQNIAARMETTSPSVPRHNSVPGPSRLREFVSGSSNSAHHNNPRQSSTMNPATRRPLNRAHQYPSPAAAYGPSSLPRTQSNQPPRY